jgi:SIR2-like domain
VVIQRTVDIEQLRKAYHAGNLVVYAGAGISVGNALPSWDKLVLAMYFSAIKRDDIVEAIRPFPNYLLAIAEWHLERRREPLDITARKVRNLYSDEMLFMERLHKTLYLPFKSPDNAVVKPPTTPALLKANPTLKAVAELCKGTRSRRTAVKSIITYNYDNLLEIALAGKHAQPIWRANQTVKRGHLPIFHVHGYVPVDGERSKPDEIVFTEEQYYFAAHNAYSWSNLVQIRHLSNSVGLMIGLSMTDRNMRRLLDALRRTPTPPENYALLQKPQWPKPQAADLDVIEKKAKDYFDRFRKSGMKADSSKYAQIKEIIDGVEESDSYEQETVLRELGVRPIWYSDHTEVPKIIKSIATG